MFEVCKKIKETKNEFRKWNREWFGNIHTKIKEKWDLFQQVQKEEPTSKNLVKEATINLELHEWLIREETLWRQKSRIKWAMVAELNTKLFSPFNNCQKKKECDRLFKELAWELDFRQGRNW